MTREPRPDERDRGELDPAAYIGREPEREAESIPFGVSDRDERVAAYGSEPGAAGEPDDGNELVSDTGETVVLLAGREYKELARNKLESFRSSLVFEGKRMYVRTTRGLWCIGE
jgi:hypothetical protein